MKTSDVSKWRTRRSDRGHPTHGHYLRPFTARPASASIDELADRFDARPYAVREALRGLSERKLVEIRHGDGAYARAPRLEDVAEALGLLLHFSTGDDTTLLLALMEIRSVLEPAATRLAAERASAGGSRQAQRPHGEGYRGRCGGRSRSSR